MWARTGVTQFITSLMTKIHNSMRVIFKKIKYNTSLHQWIISNDLWVVCNIHSCFSLHFALLLAYFSFLFGPSYLTGDPLNGRDTQFVKPCSICKKRWRFKDGDFFNKTLLFREVSEIWAFNKTRTANTNNNRKTQLSLTPCS